MSVIVLLLSSLTHGVYQNVYAVMSVGGWGGSQYFSSAVATEANRTAFAKAVMAAISQYGLDGVEFECARLCSCGSSLAQ